MSSPRKATTRAAVSKRQPIYLRNAPRRHNNLSSTASHLLAIHKKPSSDLRAGCNSPRSRARARVSERRFAGKRSAPSAGQIAPISLAFHTPRSSRISTPSPWISTPKIYPLLTELSSVSGRNAAPLKNGRSRSSSTVVSKLLIGTVGQSFLLIYESRRLPIFFRTPAAIVDKQDRVITVLAGRPNTRGWDLVQKRMTTLLEDAGFEARAPRKERRGDYVSLSHGVSYGGGQTVSQSFASYALLSPTSRPLETWFTSPSTRRSSTICAKTPTSFALPPS